MTVLFAILFGFGACAAPDPSLPDPTLKTRVAAPDPLLGQGRNQVCKSDALLLIKHPVAELENTGWTKFCCGDNPVFEGRCELDWPSSDVPSCDLWDDLRNQIYARYGYPFQGKKWQAWADKQAWYERREDFQERWLSDTARANIATLKRYAETEHHCQSGGE